MNGKKSSRKMIICPAIARNKQTKENKKRSEKILNKRHRKIKKRSSKMLSSFSVNPLETLGKSDELKPT